MASSSDVRLDELLDGVGIESLRVLTPGAGLDRVVRSVVIVDAGDARGLPRGALALAPGLAGHPAAIGEALERAAAAEVAGVALREAAWRSAAAAAAPPDAGLPVIGIPDELGWGELYELLASVLATSGRIAASAPAGRPTAQLFSFADAVAVALGGAIMIEDPQARVLAYSNVEGQTIDPVREEAILLRRVPLTERNRADYLQISRTDGPVRFDGRSDELPRIAIAVRAGAEILGFLWVVDDGTRLAPDARERIVDAARMAAVQLVRARAIDDVGRRTRADALRRLLHGARDRKLLASLGFEGKRAAGVLAARRVAGASEGEDPAAGWLSDFVALSARVRFPEALSVSIDDVAYVVVGTDRERPRELAAVGKAIVERSAGRVELQIGVGTAARIGNLGAARREADRALVALATRDANPGVATIDDVRSLAVLAELVEVVGERPALLAGPLRAMLEPAREVPAWSVPTLRAYFACFGNLSAAATELSIHPNTLRYRLARIAELLGLDLDDPDERLVLALQLRLLELGVVASDRSGPGSS